jgi:hypothetical protein
LFAARGALAAAALAFFAFAGARPAHAGAADLYYERAVMVAADQRCHLFSPELASALAAAEAQAHGAALRSGAQDSQLDAAEQRARSRAGAVACNSPDIATAAGRVRAAFDGYSKLTRMIYPGDVADWTAQRASPERYAVWKLSQSATFAGGSAVFGLAGRDGASALIATASFAGGGQPYTARLVLRDRALAPQPFLNGLRAKPGSALPLAARMPPRNATASILPEARGAADPLLVPQGARGGLAFRFPKQAALDLAALDPREAVAIDFVFAGGAGDVVRTAYFEVGDFAAGRAFLAANQR